MKGTEIFQFLCSDELELPKLNQQCPLPPRDQENLDSPHIKHHSRSSMRLSQQRRCENWPSPFVVFILCLNPNSHFVTPSHRRCLKGTTDKGQGQGTLQVSTRRFPSHADTDMPRAGYNQYTLN